MKPIQMRVVRAVTKVALIVAAVSTANLAQAHVISTLPEYSGEYRDFGFPYPPETVGTFSYSIPAGHEIISAMLTGTWGNSQATTTAHNELYVDGTLVANTQLAVPSPYYFNYVPYSYTFSDYTNLSDGSALFEVVQTSEWVVQLSESTLTIETRPIPEPATCGLAAIVCGIAAGTMRRRR